MSVFSWGIGAWPALTAADSRKYATSYWNLWRLCLPKYQKLASKGAICQLLDCPEPEDALQAARARHYITMLHHAPDPVWSVVHLDLATAKMYQAAIQWVHGALKERKASPGSRLKQPAVTSVPHRALAGKPWLKGPLSDGVCTDVVNTRLQISIVESWELPQTRIPLPTPNHRRGGATIACCASKDSIKRMPGFYMLTFVMHIALWKEKPLREQRVGAVPNNMRAHCPSNITCDIAKCVARTSGKIEMSFLTKGAIRRTGIRRCHGYERENLKFVLPS